VRTVAVIYDLGSASPIEIIRAATGICDLVFVYDRANPHAAEVAEFFEEFGIGLDRTGRSADDVATELAMRDVDGVMTFSELQILVTSAIAGRLDLRYHDPEVAIRLTDKCMQRQSLNAAGLGTVNFQQVGSASEVPRALDAVGLPAVVKPRVGAASRHVYRIDSVEQWDSIVADLPLTDFMVEELLIGDLRWVGSSWGDYVSVETVSVDGDHRCFAVLGKFAMAPPFRELGQFWSNTLSATVEADVIGMALDAVDATGLRHGVAQTEIKLTASGPRVIEVNGRMGGNVGDLVRRAGAGDPVRLALLAALGEAGVLGRPRPGTVVYQLFLPAPSGLTRIDRLGGVDEIAGYPGVDAVDIRVDPGDVVDSAEGTRSYLGILRGSVHDHTDLAELVSAVAETLQVSFTILQRTPGLP
jgi:biotin carboxylase